LCKLFPELSGFDENKPEIYAKNRNGTQTEIALAGAALRKIFVAFGLLFTLLETQEQDRIFLMEEPESQLYPALMQSFMALFFEVSDKNVQVITTTNSHQVLDMFSPSVVVFLFNSYYCLEHLRSLRIEKQVARQ
jgi:predicted ATP-dependent endonuclease of OLD family